MKNNLVITIGRECGSAGRLIGQKLAERLGVKCYDKELLSLAAKESGLTLKPGVYAYFNGPCFETAAEIRAYAVLGADAVGMSTVPETIVANYLGMEVLGLACATNMATGLAVNKHSHEEVLRIANESSGRLCCLIKHLVSELA